MNAYLLNLDRAMARLAHMRAELAISALSVYAATLAGALVFGGTAMLAPRRAARPAADLIGGRWSGA